MHSLTPLFDNPLDVKCFRDVGTNAGWMWFDVCSEDVDEINVQRRFITDIVEFMREFAAVRRRVVFYLIKLDVQMADGLFS